MGELGDEPRGTLRLYVATFGDNFLARPLLAGFLAEYPHIQLDLYVATNPSTSWPKGSTPASSSAGSSISTCS